MKRLRMTPEVYLSLFLALMLIVLASFAQGFFDLNNLMNMLGRFSYVLIAAIGMNLIILTGNIDVSTGSLISVVCLTIAALGKRG
jgi:ribose/xylose/arabinose/galactoside ABC-type transport system permease subunit